VTSAAHRWVMTSGGEPMLAAPFEPGPPQAGEVVVEVAGCGVCHTDLGFYYDGVRLKHPLPLTLGHEISGRVVEAAAGVPFASNTAVIIPAVIPCGVCDLCRRGRYAICPHQKMPGNDIHGGFATHIRVPAFGLCPVNEQRLQQAGLGLADVAVVADAVTTPYQAVARSGLGEGDVAIVIGVGGVGGYTVQIAHALGATVIAIDVDQAKLDVMAGHGAALCLNAREHQFPDLKNLIRGWVKDHGLRPSEWIIFECSGTAAGQQTAFGLITFGSTLCVVGFTLDKIELRLSNLMAFDARILGNWGCEPRHYPAALDLVLDGRIQLLPFIEQRPLNEINQVFTAVHDGEIKRRVILVPERA
jgi:6-hydroxycyclohex-1-ene-1-carbonyl-CoA dehydrogenase